MYTSNSAKEYRKFIRIGIFWGIMLRIVLPAIFLIIGFGIILLATKAQHKEVQVENHYYSTASTPMPDTKKDPVEVEEAPVVTPTETETSTPTERTPEERKVQEDLERTLRHQ